MRFLLNMNVSRVLGTALTHLGQQWAHARDLGLARADDQTVVDVSRREGMAIITNDLDYADLVALSGEDRPSVIIFRLRLSSPAAMSNRLTESWGRIGPSLEQGAIEVIEDAAVRIRSLSADPD
jgi:predicted nuclease of predicted toxin-antitoxin system